MDANRDDGRDYEHSECMIWLSLRDDQLYLQIKINLLGLSFWSLLRPHFVVRCFHLELFEYFDLRLEYCMRLCTSF